MLATRRNAKAELNRRSQACDVLTGTGIRVAENGGMESRAGVALPTGRDGFANRRLSCSANGIDISFVSQYCLTG
jgi:hypothetical protein